MNDFSPLHAACLAGNEDIVKALVRRGVNVNQEDNRLHWSTLHWAAAGGSINVVKFLVNEKGIKVGKGKRVSPEMIARDSGHEKLANFLSQLD